VIELEIHTRDRSLPADLVGLDARLGSNIDITEGAKLTYRGKDERTGAWPGLPEIFHFGLTIGSGVATKVLAD
jgi:hypothetical protein